MKMTESMKSEVVRLYFEENREEAEIAARLGISLRQAKTVLGDLARLETYKKRSEAAKLRAQICVNKSAAAGGAAAGRRGERNDQPEGGEGHPRPGGCSRAQGEPE